MATPTWCCRIWRRRPSVTRAPTICASWGSPRPRRYFACDVLRPGGTFVAKVLQGGTERELLDLLKKRFATVRHVKPPASRSDSAELYVVATGFRPESA